MVTQMNRYRESQDQHKRLFQEVVHHRDMLITALHATYESILHELDNNARRREAWIHEFSVSVADLKEELASLSNALAG